MKKQYASTQHIGRARDLRQQNTDMEKKLWNRLRDRQLGRHKFRRQHPVGDYYLDFACEELKLGVELDGGQHGEFRQQRHDAARTQALAQSGWQILRFWNNEVHDNVEGVLEVILQALTRNQRG